MKYWDKILLFLYKIFLRKNLKVALINNIDSYPFDLQTIYLKNQYEIKKK